jgi:hypothetical protein
MTKKEFAEFKSQMDASYLDHGGKYEWQDFEEETKSKGMSVEEWVDERNNPYAHRDSNICIALKDVKAYFDIPWRYKDLSPEQKKQYNANR